MPEHAAIRAQTPPVLVRAQNGTAYEVQTDQSLTEASEYVTGLLRDRKQWRNVDSAREGIADYCVEYLRRMGLAAEEELRRLGRAGVVEVAIDMSSGPAARDFAWEFVIAEATRRYRTVRAPLVVRRLIRSQPAAKPNHGDGHNVLFVRSTPGGLDRYFTFESELKLLRSTLEEDGVQIQTPMFDPTIAELSAQIASTSPALVHFAGLDGLQGGALLQWPRERLQAGMFFKGGESQDAVIVPPADLAAVACSGDTAPALVAYNIYNSSTIAAATVNAGARAAIGFQDEVDDSLAEMFFAAFYHHWQESEWDLLEAYRGAWQALASESVKLRGTGIVLWTDESLLESKRLGPSKRPASTLWLKPEDIADVRDAIEVEVVPCSKLNYSMLHNNRPLFEKFELKRLMRGTLSDIGVQIVLNAGNESSQYSANFTLTDKEPIVDVRKTARVSLTSELARSLRESVYTSVYVNVTWRNRTVRQETCRVALLPTDEWQDDDLNRIWLPSFVLPRDPAVPKIVETAQRYLMALADDPGAGFDGYQGVVAEGCEQVRCHSVDLQVSALWWALVYDYSLGYINPPPTFTNAAQRLRVPTDVIAGRRGTCIDLTLLLAALLEYIDIHPVVILLSGHAFPAYCRSEEAHQALRKLFYQVPTQTTPTVLPEPDRTGMQREWILDSRYYGAIARMVQSGQLVPLESVALTQRTGFWDSVAQGSENLRNRRDFQYLIDIKLAREADVTPIPVWSVQS